MADLEGWSSKRTGTSSPSHGVAIRPVDGLKAVRLVCYAPAAGDSHDVGATTSSAEGIPLSDLAGALVGIEDTRERMRFLDCAAFLEKDVLMVREMDTTSADIHPYAALSYVWRGLAQVEDPEDEGFFSVRGAEDGDPIGIRLLRTACIAARGQNCGLLWLDRLGIIQTDKNDKTWQIKHMSTLYSNCDACIVLPGGVSRLASLFEETPWMERAWTLQEALLPKKVICVYAWKLSGLVESGTVSAHFHLDILEPGRSAISTLDAALSSTYAHMGALRIGLKEDHSNEEIARHSLAPDGKPCLEFRKFGNGESLVIDVRILGNKKALLTALLAAIWKHRTPRERAMGIWRSAFLRASSRPVDMVFSIMGLFGVTLDPSKYAADERLKATIALSQAILQREEGRADWLGISTILDPSPEITVFPRFPETCVQGSVIVRTVEGQEINLNDEINHEDWIWFLDDAAKGSMDDHGNFKFEAKAAKIIRVKQGTYEIDCAGVEEYSDCFEQFPESDNGPASAEGELFAAVVGERTYTRDATHGNATRPERTIIIMMRRVEGNQYYRVATGTVAASATENWIVHKISVGPMPLR